MSHYKCSVYDFPSSYRAESHQHEVMHKSGLPLKDHKFIVSNMKCNEDFGKKKDYTLVTIQNVSHTNYGVEGEESTETSPHRPAFCPYVLIVSLFKPIGTLVLRLHGKVLLTRG